MSKTQPAVTIDSHVWQEFKTQVENASSEIEKLLRKQIEFNYSDNSELKEKLSRLERNIENLKEERSEITEQLEEKRKEKSIIENKIRAEEENKDFIESAIPKLLDEYTKIYRKKHDIDESLKNLKTTKTFHMWLDKVDLDSDELVDRVREEVEKDE